MLLLVGCAQYNDLSPDTSSHFTVTATSDSAATPKGAKRLLAAGESAALPRPEVATKVSGSLPFVRSQPKPVPPFPLVLNRSVQDYVNRYLAAPQGLRQSFERSQPYLRAMMSVLEQDGLPRNLVYLAFAESAFTDSGAGPWQLSKTTARRYGLTINRWVDERRDPILSTRAAAEYLAELRERTRPDWRMTLVAWNNGTGGVNRYLHLMDASYDFLMHRLPKRTRALMNRFMAVALIARDADQYGLDMVPYAESSPYRVIAVDGGTPLKSLAESDGVSVSVLRNLNPALLRGCTPPTFASYPVRIPAKMQEPRLLSSSF